jgi:excinuclease ABC subunit C
MLNARDYKKLPDAPGVYLMHDADGRVLYVGKAGNLRRRVSSYFERPHDVRIESLVRKITHIDFRQTDTALEALILEAELIKEITPPYNVREKDDKSFLYIEITREKFPRVLLVRGQSNARDVKSGARSGAVRRWGPFTSASSVREALRILRRIFPWNTHDPEHIGTFARPCFDAEIGLCPGTCVGAISHEEYLKTIERLKMFLDGKKKRLLAALEKDMAVASKRTDFEKAEKLRRQIFALKHIRDTALIADSDVLLVGGNKKAAAEGVPAEDYRIEGYDISNISGTSAVGSMVVFEGNEPNKSEYRKFKIRTIFTPNDVGMLTEMLERRFSRAAAGGKRNEANERHSWRLPDLILIDGGIAQANAAKKVLMRAGLKIPLVGIAKGPERKRNDILGAVPKWTNKPTLIKVRNEAHRFAIGYHKAVRNRNFLAR